jgi:hypothetical protein
VIAGISDTAMQPVAAAEMTVHLLQAYWFQP